MIFYNYYSIQNQLINATTKHLLIIINGNNNKKMFVTLESRRYLAVPRVLRRTPLGDHENLYLSGFAEHSGAGKPPQ
jgi:hypothetical protein